MGKTQEESDELDFEEDAIELDDILFTEALEA